MLKVATWNLENLFLPGEEGGPSDQEAFDAKLTALAATISGVNPDVLAVQEVGNPSALNELRGRLQGDWHVKLSPDHDARRIRVGFLSRLAMHGVQRVRAFAVGPGPVRIGGRPPFCVSA
jgi:hypothetical protein